ncbi:MAG: hypothetical protein OHK0039_42020 [Bacteroidia bacterium]
MKPIARCWLIVVLASLAGLQACVPVRAYQKMYLNDADMSLSSRPAEGPELQYERYREGAAGANGARAGGGCGCN